MTWSFAKNSVNVGIDLRQELHDLLHGSHDIIPIGQWVIVRKYNLNEFSEFYNEVTKEGVGGPKYTYTDTLYKAYKWYGTTSPLNEQNTIIGQMDIPMITFLFEYDVAITENDEIYEIKIEYHNSKPTLENIPKPYLSKFDIRSVNPYRLDNGRIEYIAARVVKENVK